MLRVLPHNGCKYEISICHCNQCIYLLRVASYEPFIDILFHHNHPCSMRLGYTLALVPILIKVSAINKLTSAGMGCRRVEIDPNLFKKTLSATVSAAILFLIVWTSVDMPRQVKHYEMNNKNAFGSVDVYVGCESDSSGWNNAAYVWEFLLLLSATVLTFQSRVVMQELNESHSLAFMVYSHFIFIVARVLVYAMDAINSALALKIHSLLISFDTLIAMVIYLGPKFFKVMTGEGDSIIPNRARGRRGPSRQGTGTSSGARPSYGKAGSNISGISVPRNSDGTIPRLIKPKSSSIVSVDAETPGRVVSGYTSLESTGPDTGKEKEDTSLSKVVVTESKIVEKLPLVDTTSKNTEEKEKFLKKEIKVVVTSSEIEHVHKDDIKTKNAVGGETEKETERESISCKQYHR